MQTYINRYITNEILENLLDFPVVAILGPRQCGKSTLAKWLSKNKLKKAVYLDLERDADLRKLEHPEFFFEQHKDKLVCLDEIQLKPDLFRILRPIIDDDRRNGRFLILGSASRSLIQSSSESLAGRIGYVELTPLLFNEVQKEAGLAEVPLVNIWNRGGFPDSLLSRSDSSSFRWRKNFIRTFLERDIPNLGFRIPGNNLRRMWRMLAHTHGQLLNASKLGESLGVSHTTVRSYIDILSDTFMVRILEPYSTNTKKRLVKSPKTYLRDSGIVHALLDIEDMDDLLGHPGLGSSWEGFALEAVLARNKDKTPFFYRTSSGVEIDLVLVKGRKKIAIEFKASKAPKIGKGVYAACRDLEIDELYVIAPVDETFRQSETTTISTLADFVDRSRTEKTGGLIEETQNFGQ